MAEREDPTLAELPESFQFSQSSLQDYQDCRRRFQLRYILDFAWPAVQSEPALENEHFMQQGALFHRLAQQYLVGVPDEQLRRIIQDDELRGWWEEFVDFAEQARLFSFPALRPEISLTAPLGPHRLVAKYDLIASHGDGRFTIYDWKTSRRQPARKWLVERLQTRVYPYLFVLAGQSLNGGQKIDPGSVEMAYWFTGSSDKRGRQPAGAVTFPYSAVQLERDGAFLSELAVEIGGLGRDEFRLTSQASRCAYCVYRSLCDRGERAGALAELDEMLTEGDDRTVSIDFEQIAEIEF